MSCKCTTPRIATVSGKCSDLCFVTIAGKDYNGYVPSDMGIGGGDMIQFTYCLNCGQIQGSDFPLPECEVEQLEDNEEDEDFEW